MSSIRDVIEKTLGEKMGYLFFCLILFAIGVFFGALAVRGLDAPTLARLSAVIGDFIGEIREGVFEPAGILRFSAAENLKVAGLLWLMGMTIIGVPLVLLVLFVRGFIVGFTVAFLMKALGTRGVLLVLTGILPGSVIGIPALVAAAAYALAFSLWLWRQRQGGYSRGYFIRQLSAYTAIMALFTAALLAASLVDAYITPVFLQSLFGVLS